jgi:hypothetical protein
MMMLNSIFGDQNFIKVNYQSCTYLFRHALLKKDGHQSQEIAYFRKEMERREKG